MSLTEKSQTEGRYEKQCPECMSMNVDVPEIGHGILKDSGKKVFYTDYKCRDCKTEWQDRSYENGEEETIIWEK